MNKKILSALLLVAIAFASTSMFVSCKDYDDDIKNLQTQIDKNSTAINSIQTKVNSGAILESVSPIANGVRIVINGNPYDITNGVNGTNGIDGKDGDAWTIGSDGYWYCNGVKSEFKAIGEKGDKGDKGDTGATGAKGDKGDTGATGAKGDKGDKGDKGADGADGGVYYVPKEDGYFWKVDPTTGAETKTDVKWSNQGGSGNPVVNAAWNTNNNTLTLSGLVDSNGNVTAVTISLNGKLSSLVFKPSYYFDGIETIIYPWLQDTIMKQPATPTISFSRQRASETEVKTINLKGLIASYNDEVDGTIDWWGNYYPDGGDRQDYIPTVNMFNYGIPTKVNYHLNPANAAVAYADIQGWSVLNPEVIYYNTRAAAANEFSFPEKDFGENQLFNSANGILTVGLQIANPQNLNPYPTLEKFNDPGNKKNNNTIALQVKTDEGVVTSDYALIYPEKYYVEGLAYKKMQDYTEITKNNHGAIISTETKTSNYANRVNAAARQGDQKGTFDEAKVHVWDSPVEALKDPDGAALELYYNSDEGITLRDFLEVHLVKDNVNDLQDDNVNYSKSLIKLNCSNKDEEKYGLQLEFKLVDYQIAGNISRDSRYAQMANKKDGQVIAWNVDYNASATGTTILVHDRAAIDREPLVQVLLKNTEGEVVNDGYILLHITEQAPEQKANKDIVYPTGDTYTFNLCDGDVVLKTNWDQFSKIVLTDTLKGMTKEQFDEIYEIVQATGSSAAGTTADGYAFYEVEQYLNWTDKGAGTAVAPADRLGQIIYYPNWQGTTNHAFRWTLSETELEQLTHDKANLPVEVSRWVRYDISYANGASTLAPYPYIFIKLTAKLDRTKLSDTFEFKNDNYWYDWQTGATDGWSSVVIDIKEPKDGHNIKTDFAPWLYEFRKSLVGNLENTSNPHKYYFAPKNEVVTGMGPDGKTATRTITAYHPTEQPKYDKLCCKYVATDVHTWVESTLNKTLEDCAIAYDQGAFENKYLYSYDGTNYIKIAVIDQTNGEVTLLNSPAASFEEAKLVLNLVGYEKEHKNIATELRTWAAVVSSNSCNVAKPITYDKTPDLFSFQLSWQRPINMQKLENKVMLDANTNGNVIYMIDLLKLFDWRGNNSQGKMYDGQYWFWAYYNLEKITIDLTPAKVHTTMHYNDWNKTMEDVTAYAELTDLDGAKGLKTYDFSADIAGFNSPNKEADIEEAMGIDPEDFTNKAKFGAIKYVNNGENVTTFSVRVPVMLEYYWGKIYDVIEIEIQSTAGNHD